MESQVIANNIFSQLQRIKHKDIRFARLSLAFYEAQEKSDLEKINSELTEIINEVEKKEQEQFGV